MSGVDSTKLTAAQLAAMLRKAGAKKITTSDVQEAIAGGCPTNEDGTLNVLHFAAWLHGRVDQKVAND